MNRGDDMARKSRPMSGEAVMILKDGTEVPFFKVENIGTPEQKVTYFVTDEQREEFNDVMCENIGREMSLLASQGKLSDQWYETE